MGNDPEVANPPKASPGELLTDGHLGCTLAGRGAVRFVTKAAAGVVTHRVETPRRPTVAGPGIREGTHAFYLGECRDLSATPGQSGI